MYANNRLNAAKDGFLLKLFPVCCCVSPPESVTEVRTNIYVTSFGPVSDTDMVSLLFLTAANV